MLAKLCRHGSDRTMKRRNRKRLHQLQYYCYRLYPRLDASDFIFVACRLFQQYVVDIWAICGQNRLNWQHDHQKTIRSDLYCGVADALSCDDVNLASIGKRLILPSSYTSGAWYMMQLFQDSMTIICRFGKPALFITFTVNPAWIEITSQLAPGQDCPDIVDCVFDLKLKLFLKEIKDGLFGRYIGLVQTIKFQKQGLPHMLLLLFLDPDDSLNVSEKVDDVVHAEWPDPMQELALCGLGLGWWWLGGLSCYCIIASGLTKLYRTNRYSRFIRRVSSKDSSVSLPVLICVLIQTQLLSLNPYLL
jgi:hypothetical protein